jgi:hypothetical protein
MVRNGARMNYRGVALEWKADLVRSLGDGGSVYPVEAIGLAACALHRDTVQRIAGMVPWVTKVEENERPYPALFQESVWDGFWLGEDFGLCVKAQCFPDIALDMTLRTPIDHAGECVMVDLDGEVLSDKAAHARLEKAKLSA